LTGAEAATLHSLGHLAHRDARPGEAVSYYTRALALLDRLGHSYLQAGILEHLGDALAGAGRAGPARGAWQRALDLYRGQHRAAAADRVRHRMVGRVGTQNADITA